MAKGCVACVKLECMREREGESSVHMEKCMYILVSMYASKCTVYVSILYIMCIVIRVNA